MAAGWRRPMANNGNRDRWTSCQQPQHRSAVPVKVMDQAVPGRAAEMYRVISGFFAG